MNFDRRVLIVKSGSWRAGDSPAAGSAASVTISAAGDGIKRVCDQICFGIATDATAPIATELTVTLRDGSAGTGTAIQSWPITVPAAASYNFAIPLADLGIEGSANTDMTLEFSTGLAHCRQHAFMSGYTVL